MVVEVEASSIVIAKKASEHASDMETGCGPYEACLILPDSLGDKFVPNEINGSVNILELGNGDEYVAKNKL